MNNTIFDDVFRTMIEKMPYLAVPLINEVFHTSYPRDVKITQLRNEHQQEDGEIITDSCLLIGEKLYHIECQSTDDVTMAIRMVEYDFAIAIEQAKERAAREAKEHPGKWERKYRIEFPRSCVLFLRSTRNTPDHLKADVIFPDGEKHLYEIPAIKMSDYTKDSIFEKDLLMLLPFYIMRYEKRAHELSEDPELFQILLNEYEEIRAALEKGTAGAERTNLYTDLTKLIMRIADYIFRNEEKVQKGIGEVMGGKVLQLESERLLAEGEARGKAIGEARGKAVGETIGEERLSVLIHKLIQENRNAEIQKVVTDPERRRQLYREYGI